ncbi:hypothetical protein N500_0921 [Wolbachia pipientis wUni]|nr:hypothetical protein N500_0921 [Wolbachia pipientis wUni]
MVNFLMFVASMNKHLRVTSAGRVSSQCLTLLSFVIPVPRHWDPGILLSW